MSKIEADVQQRKEFYNNPEVAKHISRDGVPRTKGAMNALISAGGAGLDSFDALSFVVFAVHPQQINVRDKLNGKIIAIINR